MRTLFLLLLSCLPCFAQLNVQQPMFQMLTATSGDFTPYSIPGLAYYWTARDFTNATPGTGTNQWIDHVQGHLLTNGNPALLPMITSTGLWFYGSGFGGRRLTNDLLNFSIGSTAAEVSMFLTIRLTSEDYANIFIDKSTAYRTKWIWYDNADADSIAAGNTWATVQGPSANWGLSGGKIPWNQYNTLCQVNSNFWDGTPHVTTYGYTNGVLSTNVASDLLIAFDTIGTSIPDGWAFNGLINEILVYTNRLTPSQISNLNHFAYKP